MESFCFLVHIIIVVIACQMLFVIPHSSQPLWLLPMIPVYMKKCTTMQVLIHIKYHILDLLAGNVVL
jgi:hypothetical protein